MAHEFLLVRANFSGTPRMVTLKLFITLSCYFYSCNPLEVSRKKVFSLLSRDKEKCNYNNHLLLFLRERSERASHGVKHVLDWVRFSNKV